MKNQLALLLLAVLFVSVPSVVFAQPPLGAVQSGETSQAASTPETVKKSLEGPFFGLGLGLGFGVGRVDYDWKPSESFGPTALLPVQLRLGYGFSDSLALYGSVLGVRALGDDAAWADPAALLGMKYRRGRQSRHSYLFTSVGVSLGGGPVGALYVRGGSGTEISPGLFVEGAGTIEYLDGEGVSGTGYVFDLTFNYLWY